MTGPRSTHGGAREGAGRKPSPDARRRYLSVRVRESDLRALDRYVAEHGHKSRSAAVLAWLRMLR